MGGKEKGAAQAKEAGALSPEARTWLNDNITGGYAQEIARLSEDLKKYERGMNFGTPESRQKAAESYRDALMKRLENLDAGIAQLKEIKGNFLLYFPDQEKQFDKYVEKLEQSRADTLNVLWASIEKGLKDGTIEQITLPLNDKVSISYLAKKYPDYRFEPLAANMESEETSVVITLRPANRIKIAAEMEGDKIERAERENRLDDKYTKFE